ncbi:enoyl-CoA hydratase [Leptospira perolatii]|uniref:Enoyl-CoA hydratase n=1 Tax=Leptospira perolatii TaxID=2023191 RepID=A0A2M9ZMA9_9LEPT|nr:enoyl-CoA hydratase-related protein [Leptospira perolatii]PJZ69851.1 enoyl-CoA hydratase [Leptospira perolatii]PJZ73167.1 enoyl-CoA hydratase [Leptospira perolatii]
MDQKTTVLTKVHSLENGKIFEIIINRPEVHNCVNGETADLLLQAWNRFREDDELVVAILRGSGDKSFCAGADLNALNTLVNINASDDEIRRWARNGTGPMGGTRVVQRKPVITISQGYTYAGGLELFCHGHIRIAEKQAMFSVACRRWGVPLADGGTVYLPWLIGPGAALPLIITGQRIRADRAQEIGLVWEVTPKGKGYERAMKYAKQICSMPRDALMADLSSAIEGYGRSLEDALEIEAKGIYPVLKSKSIKEGVEKFQKGTRFWFR